MLLVVGGFASRLNLAQMSGVSTRVLDPCTVLVKIIFLLKNILRLIPLLVLERYLSFLLVFIFTLLVVEFFEFFQNPSEVFLQIGFQSGRLLRI